MRTVTNNLITLFKNSHLRATISGRPAPRYRVKEGFYSPAQSEVTQGLSRSKRELSNVKARNDPILTYPLAAL
jgi:hypothetical protein